MNKLADNPKIKRVRFWGKIFGSTRDYYILYGEKVLQWKDDPNPEIEPDTEGVNQVSFWVSNNPLSEFKELPPIAPHHIKIAKNIKVLFSGDLDRKISSLPPFQGQERHYLKAQLVRITHGSCIVPAKIYKLKDDDDQKIEFDKDGFEFPAPAELMGLENWLHRYPNILNAGRIKHWFPANVEDEVKDKIEGEDPVKERLKTIAEDEAPQGIEAGKVVEGFEAGNWLVRTYGDTQPFTSESEKVNVYSSTLIRTLLWPGSMTLAMPMRSAWSFLYVGTGMKSVQMFIPKQPENIKDDPEDLEEFPEPNPNQAPSEKMESDSDAPADEEED
jgi:radial spoke head protein 4A